MDVSPPVLVYQMARVGSIGIQRTLKNYLPVVLHFHHLQPYLLGNDRSKEPEVLKRGVDKKEVIIDPNGFLPIRQRLLEGAPFSVICPVREPIGRELSYFFVDLITGRLPYASPTDPIDKLRQDFIEKFPHNNYREWFKYEMEAHTGINVFDVPFPESGHIVFSKENIRLLVFRIELDNDKKSDIIKEFLNLKSYQFANMNAGESLQFGNIYGKLKSLKFPTDFINEMCNSQYFKHFYNNEFIETTRQRWTQTAAL
jgi:hypothetical protein